MTKDEKLRDRISALIRGKGDRSDLIARRVQRMKGNRKRPEVKAYARVHAILARGE